MGEYEDLLRADDVVSVLTREVRVRLLNVSGSGCLVESRSQVDQGTTAVLRMRVDGDEYCDNVRITRCQEIPGGGPRFELGAEFLWTTAPDSRSIRRMAHRLRQLAERGLVQIEFAPRHVS